ncbi:MAG: M23 family metallopeptidase [Elusimicrobiales bacterium]
MNKKIIIFTSAVFLVFLVLIFVIHKLSTIRYDNMIFRRNFRFVSGVFSKTLEHELISAGVSCQERFLIIKAFDRKLDFKTLSENDRYTITFSTSGSFVSIDIDRGDTLYSVSKSSGGYIFSKRNSSIILSTQSVSSTVKNTLWDSMVDAGVPADVILYYADIFAWDIDFLTDVRDGDRFEVIYETKKNHTGRVISRRVLAGYYNGAVTGQKIMIFYDGDYYNEEGESSKSMFLKAPLQYRRISSFFSYKRYHPILKYVRPHLGIDYAAPIGTPVSSVADGIVIYKGWKAGYGNFVEIKHANSYFTSYGHLSRFANSIYVGKKVRQGDVIGYVGMTGLATGPHLDFRIRQGMRFINYLKMKRSSNKKLPPSQVAEVRKKILDYFGNLNIKI